MQDRLENAGTLYRIANADGIREIALAGELCLPSVEEIREVLAEALDGADATVVDVAGVTATDLGGLQLLCSAHRTFRARGLKLQLRDPAGQFREWARRGGFDTESNCDCRDATCLWNAGTEGSNG